MKLRFPSFAEFVLGLFTAILLWFICGGLVACNTVEKAKKTLSDNPIESAKYCADKYPVKDSIIYRDSTHLDTVYVGNDPVFDTLVRHDTVFITKTLPAKVITKTVTQLKEVYKENTARVTQLQLELAKSQQYGDRLQGELAKSEKQSAEYKGQRNKARWQFWGLLLLLGVGVALKLKKII